jgi:hypothetical protein
MTLKLTKWTSRQSAAASRLAPVAHVSKGQVGVRLFGDST